MLEAGTAVRRVVVPRALDADQIAALLHTCDELIRRHAPPWLGHCKALIETPHGNAYASITGAHEPLSWRGAIPPSSEQPMVTVYCVAYGVTNEQMAEIVDQVVAEHLPGATDVVPAQVEQITLEWETRRT